MTEAPSLARRVVGHLVIALIVAFSIAWIVSVLLGLAGIVAYNNSLGELAAIRATNLVISSLVRGGDDPPRIEPTLELQNEMRRTPGFQFAVFDPVRSKFLHGSSPKLASAFEGLIKVRPYHMHFAVSDDPWKSHAGHLELANTPYGKMQVVVYGQAFQWDDLLYVLGFDLTWMAAYLIAALLLATGICWIAVRRGLKPLTVITRTASQINMNSLQQRLPIIGVPAEIAPLICAMNDALARLDAGAMRMRRYTANAAHELRTPLAIMRARLEDTEEPTFKSDLMRDASQLQAIVEQMLIASRLTEGHARLDQEIDLAKTLRQIVLDYMPLVIECGRRIEFEAGDTPIVVRGNQRAIECVVANLIDNALRAEPSGGTVLVRVCNTAVVEVIDHGIGVCPNDRERIFEPFWRGSETTPGTGLGLAIAEELVEKLQGNIWVEETLGGGATFKILLPFEGNA